jgi:hypothetical protein
VCDADGLFHIHHDAAADFAIDDGAGGVEDAVEPNGRRQCFQLGDVEVGKRARGPCLLS